MPLWVGHHEHDALVVVVPLVGPPSTELLDLAAADLDVIDLHVEVQPNLCRLALGNLLEGQPRLPVESRPDACPARTGVFLGDGASQQLAPEQRQPRRVPAVDASRFAMR